MRPIDGINVLSYLLGFALCVSTQQTSPRVTTDAGKMEGYYKVSFGGRRYEAYEGIPYAKPPTGALRFQPPVNYTDWGRGGTVLRAKDLHSACMQYDQARETIRGSEDCLYLNVYCPQNDSVVKLHPVIFYIHGEDFQTGSAADYGPEYLLDRNVVLVTFNYRVGPLGFLSTGDDVVPGNMGLKDQVLALRWVRRNVMKFGGDEANIAIIGHGAGGASVHYHYLTKQTRGLFNKGMSMSGTALAPWAMSTAPRVTAIKFAAAVECPTQDMSLMVKCLMDQPADHLIHAAVKLRRWKNVPYAPFAPVVESGKHSFTYLEESPMKIITAGKAFDAPWIAGVVDEEGLTIVEDMIIDQNTRDELNYNWETIAPPLFDYVSNVPESRKFEVSESIKQHYMELSPFDRATISQAARMIGDRFFTARTALAALLQVNALIGPVRFYKFSYSGARTFSKKISDDGEIFGPTHKDDLAYVFRLPIDYSAETPKDQEMREKLLDLWVSYATDGYGDPIVGVRWTHLQENTALLNFLHIMGPANITMDFVKDLGNQRFWKSLSADGDDISLLPPFL